jgi:flagellar basal body-associated protein FliL
MKYNTEKSSSALIFIHRMLAGILILIILAIFAGTMFAIIFKPNEKEIVEPIESQSDERIFTGIGRIRTKSAEPKSAAVVITIAFPYNPDDASFSEELASKVAQFRNETTRYFEAFTADELRQKTDDAIQRELLARYNALLRLGFIDVLYITDYMIID